MAYDEFYSVGISPLTCRGREIRQHPAETKQRRSLDTGIHGFPGAGSRLETSGRRRTAVTPGYTGQLSQHLGAPQAEPPERAPLGRCIAHGFNSGAFGRS
jgi:hypothetical protein